MGDKRVLGLQSIEYSACPVNPKVVRVFAEESSRTLINGCCLAQVRAQVYCSGWIVETYVDKDQQKLVVACLVASLLLFSRVVCSAEIHQVLEQSDLHCAG
jgi:hypothetical protein